jgi:hypothetical protein
MISHLPWAVMLPLPVYFTTFSSAHHRPNIFSTFLLEMWSWDPDCTYMGKDITMLLQATELAGTTKGKCTLWAGIEKPCSVYVLYMFLFVYNTNIRVII